MIDDRPVAELDTVVLKHDVPEHGLQQGDVGTVVHVYAEGHGFEVELATGDGSTVAVLTLASADVRPVGSHEILHARTVARS
jgi:hypothetical protein